MGLGSLPCLLLFWFGNSDRVMRERFVGGVIYREILGSRTGSGIITWMVSKSAIIVCVLKKCLSRIVKYV